MIKEIKVLKRTGLPVVVKSNKCAKTLNFLLAVYIL